MWMIKYVMSADH